MNISIDTVTFRNHLNDADVINIKVTALATSGKTEVYGVGTEILDTEPQHVQKYKLSKNLRKLADYIENR